MTEITCRECGRKFTPTDPHQRICSKMCLLDRRRKQSIGYRTKKHIDKTKRKNTRCKECGALIDFTTRAHNAVTCCESCKVTRNRRLERIRTRIKRGKHPEKKTCNPYAPRKKNMGKSSIKNAFGNDYVVPIVGRPEGSPLKTNIRGIEAELLQWPSSIHPEHVTLHRHDGQWQIFIWGKPQSIRFMRRMAKLNQGFSYRILNATEAGVRENPL